MSRGQEPTPPLLAHRILARVLPDDAWSAEFLEALDDEFRRRSRRDGVASARRWYGWQLCAPRTLHFVWLVRRRRRTRDMGNGGWGMGGWMTDLRHAVRSSRREPRLAVFIVLALALGIGSNAAIYGVADKLFLRGPAHVSAPQSLVRIFLRMPGTAGEGDRWVPWIPYATATAIREQSTSLRAVSLYRFEERVAKVGADVTRLRVAEVDGSFFGVLGASPHLGRFFGEEASTDGQAPVVVSHEFWRRSLGGRPDAVGSTLELAGLHARVVGVARPGFSGPHLERVDAWIPMDVPMAGNRNWFVVARVPGTEVPDAGVLAQLGTEANTIHKRTPPGRFYTWAEAGDIEALPLTVDDAGGEAPEVAVARLLLGVVGLVLLIAAANVVNLLLSRMSRRRDEIMVRAALGSGRWRLTRLLITESVVLSVLGGVAAIPVAWMGGVALRRVLLPQVAWSEAPVDPGLMAITLAAAVLTGVVVGILPARYAGRMDLRSGIASQRGGRSKHRVRIQSALATAQVGLSAALLLCAGLFLKSFWTMRVTDLGMDAASVLAISLQSVDPDAVGPGAQGEPQAYQAALRTVRSLSSVEGAALTVGLPFMYNFGWSVHRPGLDSVPELPGGGPWVSAVTGDYFRTMGTPILQGTGISDDDVARGEAVVVVSESMARILWPGGDALGSCLRLGSADSPCSTVVGIAGDVHRQGYREAPSMQFYVPLGMEGGFGGTALVVRPTSTDAIPQIRSAVAASAALPLHVEVTSMSSLLDAEIRPWQLGSVVLGLAAILAVLVSVIGVYGVISYVVTQRRQEIGLRIALGASAASVRGLVLKGGGTTAGVGVALGLLAVVAGRTWVEPLLYETRVLDPGIMLAVAALLGGAAFLASLLPAVHATRVDPVECLRDGD